MQCPKCGTAYEDGQTFCGACGEPLPAAVEAEPPAEDAQLAYDREYARYQEEYAAWQAGQSTSAAPQYPAPAVGTTPAPVKKRKTGLIIALVIVGVVVVLVGILAVLGVLGLRSFSSSVVDTPAEVSVPAETTAPEGFDSAEEAVKATLPEYGSDWVYTLNEESTTKVVYWAGPPASEYAVAITVSRGSDGAWSVTAADPLDFASDVPSGSENTEMSSAEEASSIVSEHLQAVKEDRAMDAHALTVDPFASDSASAQYSNGDFKSFTVDGAKEQSDGSFWVKTTQVWTWGAEKWQYWVVPTDAGYRISQMKEW